MVGTVEVPRTLHNANASANPYPNPDQGIREASGTGNVERVLGKGCVGRPQTGACGADFGRKHVLDARGALGTVSASLVSNIGVD